MSSSSSSSKDTPLSALPDEVSDLSLHLQAGEDEERHHHIHHTRRSHRKSKLGCHACKSRRIKCGEEKPICHNCVAKNALCIYPNVKPAAKRSPPRIQQAPSILPSTSSDVYTIQDMQFFHHFLTIARPHQPLGNNHVWAHEIPQFAQEHPYLMHGMLALGASHLMRISNNRKWEAAALAHRVHALSGIKDILIKSSWSYGEADALLATCYTLIFQSIHMHDGLVDYLSLLRGSSYIMNKIHSTSTSTAFDLTPTKHIEIVSSRLHQLPPIHPDLIIHGLNSLATIQPLLSTELEISTHTILTQTLESHQTSPQQGYFSFGLLFKFWFDMSQTEFNQFITFSSSDDTSNNHNSNPLLQILLAHFIALQMLMMPASAIESPERVQLLGTQSIQGMIEWCYRIWKNVPPKMQMYLGFPKRIVATVQAEANGQPVDGPSVLQYQELISRLGLDGKRKEIGL